MVRLIPAIYAFWNAVKSGSDTTTKIMDDRLLRIPKAHLNSETVAITRLLSLSIVLVHRLSQTFSAKKDLNFYPNLFRYRKDASERLTFHANLLKCQKHFKKEVERLDEQEAAVIGQQVASRLPLQQISANQQRPLRPIRRRVDGVLPEYATFGATLPSRTPTKLSSRVKSGTAPPEVEAMIVSCNGRPMKLYCSKDEKRRQYRCAVCGKKTMWRCIGCKRWLCLERKTNKDEQALDGLYECPVKGEKLNFQKSCFHKVHQNKWTNANK